MALPKLDTPIHSMTLPSTGEEIKYRPFLVKEQKLMLVAQDTKDVKESYNNLKEIIDACTFNKIDIENSPIFDIEYMFLKVRSKSIGSKANVNVICPDDLETRQMVEIDLDEILREMGYGEDDEMDITQLSKSEIKELIKVEVKKYFEETFEDPEDLGINEILKNLYK